MIFGSLAGGGTLGILIPPSVPFIIYGVMAQESITDLFAAGIIPGIVLTLIFMSYIAIRVLVTPRLVPDESREASLSAKEKALALVHVLPVFGLIFLVLGGIYLRHYDSHRGSSCRSIRFDAVECLLREAERHYSKTGHVANGSDDLNDPLHHGWCFDFFLCSGQLWNQSGADQLGCLSRPGSGDLLHLDLLHLYRLGVFLRPHFHGRSDHADPISYGACSSDSIRSGTELLW